MYGKRCLLVRLVEDVLVGASGGIVDWFFV
jgi:hypothetical protein